MAQANADRHEGHIPVEAETLRRACRDRFAAAGVPPDEADIIAHSLVEADRRGVETHGVVCAPRYIALIEKGLMRAKAAYETERDIGAIAVWNGLRSNGQVLGRLAMLEATRKAGLYGVGIVAVRSGNHFGAGAYYAQLALDAGLIGVAMSTGSPTMAPWGGADRLIGNNPVAVAVPSGAREDIVLDMAMSNVAFGKITNRIKAGERDIPPGWAFDSEGVETTDAGRVHTVIPAGAHKGFGMALIVDILAGILFGGSTGPRAADDAQGPSHLFAALSPAAFGDEEAFKQAMDGRIDELKGSRPARGSGGVYMPGEIEAAARAGAGETVWIMPEILRGLMALPAREEARAT